MRQRRRKHRSGLLPKGELIAIYKTKEWYRANKWNVNPEVSEPVTGVNQVPTDIVIEQTEAGSGNFYEFEPDVYEAIVADIEQVDNPFEDDKTQLQFTFEVPGYQNEDGSVANKRAWANPVWNSKSKLWKWAQVITGSAPEAGVPFRTSILIGKPCRIVMNADTNQKGEAVIKITDVLASKQAAPAPAKKGLVAAIKKDGPPPKADVLDFDMCSAPGCAMKADAYTSKGTPFCEPHMP